MKSLNPWRAGFLAAALAVSALPALASSGSGLSVQWLRSTDFSVVLRWESPDLPALVDDGGYFIEIRRWTSLDVYQAQGWSSGTVSTGTLPDPNAYGMVEAELDGLDPSTNYWFMVGYLVVADPALPTVRNLPPILGVTLPVETLPPAAVVDLGVTTLSDSSITLVWTATGDDGTVGRATRYDLRHSPVPIDDSTFSSATPVSGTPNPGFSGEAELFQVRGLAPSTTYHFALKVVDDRNNWSALSYSVQGMTLAEIPRFHSPDSGGCSGRAAGGVGPAILLLAGLGALAIRGTRSSPRIGILSLGAILMAAAPCPPPFTITDLAASVSGGPAFAIHAEWTAPEDPGGPILPIIPIPASEYDIRYQVDVPLTEENWDSAIRVPFPPPSAVGTIESLDFYRSTNQAEILYLAVRSLGYDGWSPISNVVDVTLLPPPPPPPPPPSPVVDGDRNSADSGGGCGGTSATAGSMAILVASALLCAGRRREVR